jgi:hypothetical protein
MYALVRLNLQVNNNSPSAEKGKVTQRKLVEELRGEWVAMWSTRYDDQIRAEGVSAATYDGLHVERGTIIHATRDYKPLNFKEILQEHNVENPDRYIQPSSVVGGWNKFVKTQILGSKKIKAKALEPQVSASKKPVLQPKKGGRGWLHTT